MEESHKTRNLVFIVLGISILLIAIVAFAFVMFFRGQSDNVEEVVKTGVVSMNYKTETNQFTLTNLTPMSNDSGKELRDEGSYFDFSVSSEVEDDTAIQYEIALIKDDSSTISDNDIVVYLERQSSGSYAKVEEPLAFTPISKKSDLGSPSGSMVLGQVSLSSSRVDNYRLRLWIREGAVIADPNASYTVEVKVYVKAQ